MQWTSWEYLLAAQSEFLMQKNKPGETGLEQLYMKACKK